MMRRLVPVRRIGLAALALLLALGCARAPGGGPVADWAQEVERLRGQAESQRRSGDLVGAEATLREVLALRLPAPSPAARSVVHDTFFALGSVLLQAGRSAEAVAEASRGLRLVEPPPATVFVANLYALRAMAYEEGGHVEDAAADYVDAVRIHKVLFDQALAAHDGKER